VFPVDLVALRRAGQIAARARRLGAGQISPRARPRAVCDAVEAEIDRLGGALAFPVQIAVNETAAHFCPADEDTAEFRDGDLAKLDVGVHVDGWVVDTAVSVNVGGGPERARLVQAAEAALAAALAAATPGVPIAQLSQAIETTIRGFGLRPVANLCGHGVGRWTVHCPPPVPNQPEGEPTTHLAPGTIVAVEVFATDGEGHVEERGQARIHRLDPAASTGSIDPELVARLRALRGLPFRSGQIDGFPEARVAAALDALATAGHLRSYRPLVDPRATAIAQAEHTIYVHEDRIETLTL
jgi:methionyl aminopeptidase